MNTPTTAAPHAVRGNHVMLRADTLRLLLPQAQVGNADYLEATPFESGMPGVFGYPTASGERVLLALSRDMQPMEQYPKDRFVVTPIATAQGEVGFGWNEVSVMIDVNLQAQPVPAALVTADSPLRHFVEINGEVVFCCDASRLADYALASHG